MSYFVQRGNATAQVASVAATFGAGTTTGNKLVAILCQYVNNTGGSFLPPVAPTGPSGWTHIGNQFGNNGSCLLDAWYLDNNAGGITTVTVNRNQNPATSAGTLFIYELNNVATGAPFMGNGNTFSTVSLAGISFPYTGFGGPYRQPGIAIDNLSAYDATFSSFYAAGQTGQAEGGVATVGYAASVYWDSMAANAVASIGAYGTPLGGGYTYYGFAGIGLFFPQAPIATPTISVSGTQSVSVTSLKIITQLIKVIGNAFSQAAHIISAHVPYIVQVITNETSGDTAIHFTSAPTGANHTLVVFIDVNTDSATTITPPAGWVDSGEGLININSQSNQYFQAFYYSQAPAGQTSYTFNFSSAQSSVAYSGVFAEISGLDLSQHAPHLLASANHASSSAPTIGPTGSSASANEMVVQAIGTVGGQFGNVMTGDSNYVNTQIGNNAYNQMVFGWRVTKSSNTQSATDALPTTAEAYAGVLMSFPGLPLPPGHFRSLLVTGSASLFFFAVAPLIEALTVAGTGTIALIATMISIFQAITVAGTGAVVVDRFLMKLLAVAGTHALAVVKLLKRHITLAGTGAARVLRQLSVPIVVAGTHVASVGRALLITITVVGTHVVKVLITYVRILFVAGTGLVRMPWVLALAALLVAGTGTVTVTPAFVLVMLVVGTHHIAAIVFTRLKTLVVAGTSTVSFAYIRAVFIIVHGSQTVAVVVRRIYIITIKALNTGSRVAIQKLVKLGWTIYGGGRV